MKVTVAYMSQSGNTRRVADAIFDEIDAEKQILALDGIQDLGDCDLAFVGFPMHNLGAPAVAKDFLRRCCTGRRIALFVTHASPESDSETFQNWLGACREAASGARLLGMFDCQGALAPAVKQAMLTMGDPNLRRWAEMDNSQGQPDDSRLARARTFAREIMSREASMHDAARIN